jgi:hypothetical protein
MALHLGRMTAITLLILFCTFYAFLPGRYDGLAVPLSLVARTLGMAGLLLVPIGIVWLAHELRNRAKRAQDLPYRERGYAFAVASVAALSVVAVGVSLAAATASLSLGFLAIALSAYAGWRITRRLRISRDVEHATLDPAPLYLTFLPVAVLIGQLALGGRATELSRNRAIDNSADLIDELEKYRVEHGRYPGSLLAMWPDYHPGVIGIERYHYAQRGDAYDLAFEQASFRWGTREFVVYNRRDDQIMVSHTAWILIGRPDALETRQGWYAVHDASRPHWKYFWFD